jgi:hypothetical protein
VPSEGGNSLPLRGLRSFSSIERPSTLAGEAKNLGCLLANRVPPTTTKVSILAMAKIIIS